MKRIHTVQSILRATLIPALFALAVVLSSLNCAAIRAKAHAVIPAVVQTDHNLLLLDEDMLFHLIDSILPVVGFLFIIVYIVFLIRKAAKESKESAEEARKHAPRPKKAVRGLSADPERELKERIGGKLIETPVTCPHCGAIGYTDNAGRCRYCGRQLRIMK